MEKTVITIKEEIVNPRELKYEINIENIEELKEQLKAINSNLSESLEKIDELERRLKNLELKSDALNRKEIEKF